MYFSSHTWSPYDKRRIQRSALLVPSTGFFWNMAKKWLVADANWHDPQAAFDKFRKRVFEYMCDGGKWACCTAGERDVSCRNPPKAMQDIIHLFSDPAENMPVIFLFWWCMNVSVSSSYSFCSSPSPPAICSNLPYQNLLMWLKLE